MVILVPNQIHDNYKVKYLPASKFVLIDKTQRRKDISNALTVFLIIGCFDIENYASVYNLSVVCFCYIATFNHFLSTYDPQSTHIVKAAFTLLLGCTHNMPVIFTLSVTLLTGVMYFRDFKIEWIGGGFRQGLSLYFVCYQELVFSQNYSLVTIIVLAKLLYFYERNHRIQTHTRYKYSWLHNAEHLGDLYYFYYFHPSGTSIFHQDSIVILCLFVMGQLMLFNTLVFKLLNAHLYYFYTTLPSWFDTQNKQILEYYQKKCYRNYSSNIFQSVGNAFKLFNPKMSMEYMSWSQLTQIIDSSIPLSEQFDIAIGILSGGGFMVKRVAEKNNIPQYYYWKSQVWSGVNVYDCVVQHLGHAEAKKSYPFGGFDPTIIKGKRVLVVDDSVYSGTTMRTTVKILQTFQPRVIKTYCLFNTNPNVHVDYCSNVDIIPVSYPWGVECD